MIVVQLSYVFLIETWRRTVSQYIKSISNVRFNTYSSWSCWFNCIITCKMKWVIIRRISINIIITSIPIDVFSGTRTSLKSSRSLEIDATINPVMELIVTDNFRIDMIKMPITVGSRTSYDRSIQWIILSIDSFHLDLYSEVYDTASVSDVDLVWHDLSDHDFRSWWIGVWSWWISSEGQIRSIARQMQTSEFDYRIRQCSVSVKRACIFVMKVSVVFQYYISLDGLYPMKYRKSQVVNIYLLREWKTGKTGRTNVYYVLFWSTWIVDVIPEYKSISAWREFFSIPLKQQ